MSLFTSRNSQDSRQTMSLEYKCMFAYHIAMIIMFIAGGSLTVEFEVGIALLIVIIAVLLSLHHRHRVGWRWPGITAQRLLTVLFVTAGGVIFLGSSISSFPPLHPHSLPWYLAGGGIVVFNILQALRFVTTSEADFIRPPLVEKAADTDSTNADQKTPWWHKLLHGVYVVFFVATFLIMSASHHFSGLAFQNGSPTPTATQTEPIRNHGTVVYITSAEKTRLDLLNRGQLGIPLIIAFSTFCHFVLGVKIFSNVPTLAEYKQRRNNPAFASSTIEGPVKVCHSCGLRNIPERELCKRCAAPLGPVEP